MVVLFGNLTVNLFILLFKILIHSKAKYVLSHTNTIVRLIWNLICTEGKYKLLFNYVMNGEMVVFLGKIKRTIITIALFKNTIAYEV